MNPSGVRLDVPRSAGGSSERRTRLRELALYFLRLGTLGFGGPIALVGHMQKDLVEGRQWFSQQDYLQAWLFASSLPDRWPHNWRSISARYRHRDIRHTVTN